MVIPSGIGFCIFDFIKFNTMKQLVYTVFSLITFSAVGQYGYTEPVTNGEGSEYQLTKVHHLDATPVESQGWTGTCWSFSSLSFFESELMRMGIKDPKLLSEMYIARKGYEMKAEKYVRVDGKGNFSEGGEFHDIPSVIDRYGVVPLEVYDGLNYGSETHDHSEMFSVLNGAVQGLIKHMKSDDFHKLTPAWKNALTGILDAYFGEDIKEFELDGKKYTPKSYAKSLGLDMDNYVSLTSFTHHDMYEECNVAIPDNWAWKSSYNVPLDEMFKMCEAALKEGYTLLWTADVSEKGFSFSNGLAINPEDKSTIMVSGRDNKNFSDGGADKKSNAFKTPVEEVDVTPEMRQEGYENKTTTDDHLMHIVGLYKDQNGTKYFLVKNSWGTGNYPEGYLYASESYFKWKTIMVSMHKDGLTGKMKKKLNLE